MTDKERAAARLLASSVLTRQAIHEPSTVQLAVAVMAYEEALAPAEVPVVALVSMEPAEA